MRPSDDMSDEKIIAAMRKKNEKAMDAEIDSLLATRTRARKSLNDDLQPVKPYGKGARTLNARAGYRGQTIWSRMAKQKYGALD
jgi:hypothetical protein